MTEQATGAAPTAPEPIAPAVDTSNNAPIVNNTNAAPEPVKTEAVAQPAAEKPAEKTTGILPKEVAPVETSQPVWSEKWREEMASGDEKALKELQKHKSPADAIKAYRELQKEFSRTRPLPQLAKDATPEQVKEYREAAGIPESWEKYDIQLDKGLTIGEADKPAVNEYLKEFHNANLKPEEVKKVLQIHFEHQNKIAAEAMKIVEAHEQQTATTLRQELGVKYDESLNKAASFLQESLGSESYERLRQAVAPDGTLLINDPKLLKHFIDAAGNKYGNATPPPTVGHNLASQAAKKAELEKIAATNPKLWYDSLDLRTEYSELTKAG